MRYLVFTIFVCANINAYAQKIPLEKLLSFIGNDASKTINYLQLSGWDFNENQYKNNDSLQITSFWTYGNTGDSLYHQIYFSMRQQSFSVDKKDIWEIGYHFYSKNEYLNLLNSLLNGHFKKTAGINYGKNTISQDFYYPFKFMQSKDSVLINIHLTDWHHADLRGIDKGYEDYELEIDF